MAQTQREPVPRTDTGELDTALAFLAFARSCVVKKLDGLDEEQQRRVMVPSGTSLLGLVQHLAAAERFWFGHHVAGGSGDVDLSMAVPPRRSAQEVLDDYRRSCTASDAVVRGIGDPASGVAIPVDGERLSLRWVLAHMTSETARHAGHADILRELVDGTTGR